MPRPKKISELKSVVAKLAQTSHYEVSFGGLNDRLSSYLQERGVDTSFITRSAGLLCSSASIPGSSLATADINGNFMGVQEKMAHSRIFTEMQLEFYVDSDYRMIKFLEHWMEFITDGSEVDQSQRRYYYRMRYPDLYKCDKTKIVKFDRDFKKEIEYTFIGLFPKNLTSIPVSYDSSNILKVSASFEYERYIAGKSTSKSVKSGSNSNKDIEQNSRSFVGRSDGTISSDRLRQSLAEVEPFEGSIRQAADQTGRLDLARTNNSVA